MMLILSGCANGIKAVRETDLQSFKKTDFGKVVYYKPVYYQAGWTQWTYVNDTPIKPFRELVAFEKMFIKDTVEIMKENGFTMVEVDRNPGNGIFIEIRVAVVKPRPFFQDPVAATRWYIFYPSSKKPVEIYKFSLHDSLGFGSLDESLARDIAQKATGYFLSIVPASPGKQASSK